MASKKKLSGIAFRKQKKRKNQDKSGFTNIMKSWLLPASSNDDDDSNVSMDSNPSVLQTNSTNDVDQNND